MPMVNGKKFPYTGKGMMDAAAAKKKNVDMPEPGGKGSSMTPSDRNKARDKAMAGRKGMKQELPYSTAPRDFMKLKNKEALARRARKNSSLKEGGLANKRRGMAMEAYNKKTEYMKGKDAKP